MSKHKATNSTGFICTEKKPKDLFVSATFRACYLYRFKMRVQPNKCNAFLNFPILIFYL